MRSIIFAKRNVKEIVRDPISYIFLLAFPIIMLFVMSIINSSIPAEAQVPAFKIENLSVGICVFSFTFDMLFAALHISADRDTAFLTRLYSTPMNTADFLLGYSLPLLITAILQCIIVFALSSLPFISADITISLTSILLTILSLIPSAIFYIGLGTVFGSLFNNKSAPPIASIIITLSGMFGGIWMDIEMLGSTLTSICKSLPFYRTVEVGRATLNGRYGDIPTSMVFVVISAIITVTVSVIAFNKKSKK